MTGTEGRVGRDFKHMNADFGGQVWMDLLPRLRTILSAKRPKDTPHLALAP